MSYTQQTIKAKVQSCKRLMVAFKKLKQNLKLKHNIEQATFVHGRSFAVVRTPALPWGTPPQRHHRTLLPQRRRRGAYLSSSRIASTISLT